MASIETQEWRDSDLDALLNEVQIEIQFSAFTDGRGYSLAQLLLRKHAYAGQLVATGHISEHQSVELKRAGFHAMRLEDGREIDLTSEEKRSAFYDNYFH